MAAQSHPLWGLQRGSLAGAPDRHSLGGLRAPSPPMFRTAPVQPSLFTVGQLGSVGSAVHPFGGPLGVGLAPLGSCYMPWNQGPPQALLPPFSWPPVPGDPLLLSSRGSLPSSMSMAMPGASHGGLCFGGGQASVPVLRPPEASCRSSCRSSSCSGLRHGSWAPPPGPERAPPTQQGVTAGYQHWGCQAIPGRVSGSSQPGGSRSIQRYPSAPPLRAPAPQTAQPRGAAAGMEAFQMPLDAAVSVQRMPMPCRPMRPSQPPVQPFVRGEACEQRDVMTRKSSNSPPPQQPHQPQPQPHTTPQRCRPLATDRVLPGLPDFPASPVFQRASGRSVQHSPWSTASSMQPQNISMVLARPPATLPSPAGAEAHSRLACASPCRLLSSSPRSESEGDFLQRERGLSRRADLASRLAPGAPLPLRRPSQPHRLQLQFCPAQEQLQPVCALRSYFAAWASLVNEETRLGSSKASVGPLLLTKEASELLAALDTLHEWTGPSPVGAQLLQLGFLSLPVSPDSALSFEGFGRYAKSSEGVGQEALAPDAQTPTRRRSRSSLVRANDSWPGRSDCGTQTSRCSSPLAPAAVDAAVAKLWNGTGPSHEASKRKLPATISALALHEDENSPTGGEHHSLRRLELRVAPCWRDAENWSPQGAVAADQGSLQLSPLTPSSPARSTHSGSSSGHRGARSNGLCGDSCSRSQRSVSQTCLSSVPSPLNPSGTPQASSPDDTSTVQSKGNDDTSVTSSSSKTTALLSTLRWRAAVLNQRLLRREQQCLALREALETCNGPEEHRRYAEGPWKDGVENETIFGTSGSFDAKGKSGKLGLENHPRQWPEKRQPLASCENVF